MSIAWMSQVEENDRLDADIRKRAIIEDSADEILWQHNVWTA
jgi:hypothetical protein